MNIIKSNMNNNKGISIIEIVIGILIFSIGILAIAEVQTSSTKGNIWALKRTNAMLLAQVYMETALSIAYDSLNSAGISKNCTFNNISYGVNSSITDNGNDTQTIEVRVSWDTTNNREVVFTSLRSYAGEGHEK